MAPIIVLSLTKIFFDKQRFKFFKKKEQNMSDAPKTIGTVHTSSYGDIAVFERPVYGNEEAKKMSIKVGGSLSAEQASALAAEASGQLGMLIGVNAIGGEGCGGYAFGTPAGGGVVTTGCAAIYYQLAPVYFLTAEKAGLLAYKTTTCTVENAEKIIGRIHPSGRPNDAQACFDFLASQDPSYAQTHAVVQTVNTWLGADYMSTDTFTIVDKN